jgi:hypothetical protein
MSDTNTGGPAFPCEWDYIGSKREAANGMTLRDYFAAKAMQSFTADVGWKSDQQWFEEIAEGAYRQADAMLKARK